MNTGTYKQKNSLILISNLMSISTKVFTFDFDSDKIRYVCFKWDSSLI